MTRVGCGCHGSAPFHHRARFCRPLLQSANTVHRTSRELLVAVCQFPGNSGPSTSEVIHFPEFTVAAHMLSLFTKTYLCIYLLCECLCERVLHVRAEPMEAGRGRWIPGTGVFCKSSEHAYLLHRLSSRPLP